MLAERFGSYSMVATVAGTSNLSRLVSTSRSLRLWAPPRDLEVRRPKIIAASAAFFTFGERLLWS